MAPMEVASSQNVVIRVVSLPLVSSTYDMVSSVYANTKDSHPYLKSVCEVAELGVKTITSVALTSAMPIIDKLEPQIAIANNLACKGLDKIEKTLPILHQPSEQVVTSAKNVVTGAKDAVAVTVNGAREKVSSTISGVVDKTRGAVQDSVEMTRTVVSGGVNTVMGSRVAHLLATGVDTALSKTETMVDQYLPLTKEELEKEATLVEGFDEAQQKPNYYVRLGSLSLKLRRRAYQQAVAKVRDAKQRSQTSISQLHHTVDLIEYARKNVDGASQKLHEKFYSWVEWKTQEPGEGGQNEAEHIGSRTLAIARNLSHQLQTTCLTLVSSLQGLPQNVQNHATSAARSASEVYGNFSKASSLRDVSDSVLTSSRDQLAKIKNSLDGVMDYFVNNTPLNWLVGPFYPRMSPAPSGAQEDKNTPAPVPADVEMKPLDSTQ